MSDVLQEGDSSNATTSDHNSNCKKISQLRVDDSDNSDDDDEIEFQAVSKRRNNNAVNVSRRSNAMRVFDDDSSDGEKMGEKEEGHKVAANINSSTEAASPPSNKEAERVLVDTDEEDNADDDDDDDDETDESLFQLDPEKLALKGHQKANHNKIQSILNNSNYWQKWFGEKLRVKNDESDPAQQQQQQEQRKDNDVIKEWRNDAHGDWYCYWDDSYAMPQDRENNFVFQPPLVNSYCDVVRPMEWKTTPLPATADTSTSSAEGFDAREAYKCLEELIMIVEDEDYDLTIGWGDEGNYKWKALLLPWDVTVNLTPKTLLEQLGAHEQVKTKFSLRAWVFNNDVNEKGDDDDDTATKKNKEGLQAIQDFLDQYETSIVFSAGEDKLNPVPCFAVAQVQKDLVAGFVGGVVHT